MEYFNIETVRQFLNLIHPEGNAFEVRLISENKRNYPFSGYFDNIETAIYELSKNQALLKKYNCYVTINPVNTSLLSREQNNKIIQASNTTNDKDIVKRNFIVIDIDTKDKPTGINASEDEKKHNHRLGALLYKELERQNFNIYMVADSANGYHLYLPVNMPNDESSTKLVEKFLQTLNIYINVSGLFEDLYNYSEIDTSIFNASRIIKVIGTYSRKGADTKERPQRLSDIVLINEYKLNDKSRFESFIREYGLQEEIRENKYNSNFNRYFNGNSFSLEYMIQQHGIEVYKKIQTSWGTKYLLKQCLFNPDHINGDAMLTQNSQGAIGYYCFHNSCAGNKWQQVKEKLGLNTNSYKKTYQPRQMRDVSLRITIPNNPNIEESIDTSKQWFLLKDYDPMYDANAMYIPTGFETLKQKMIGFREHEISVLTATAGSGKTNLLLQLAVNAIDEGHKVGIFSGEQSHNELSKWLYLIAAGKSNIKSINYNGGVFYKVYDHIRTKINNWVDDKLYIYNNDYEAIDSKKTAEEQQSNLERIVLGITDKIINDKVTFIALDNLMVLDSEFSTYEKFTAQKLLMLKLKELSKKYKVHILLIAHPRKTFQYLTMYDVAGSSDVVNLAQNVFILHRLNDAWFKKAKEVMSKDMIDKITFGEYSALFEICKNRNPHGVRDVYMPLYFDTISKRFSEEKDKVFIYGFEKEKMIEAIDETIDIPAIQPNTSFDDNIKNNVISAFEDDEDCPY